VTGRFVSVEGIDAAGKSTLARSLADRLRADGRPVLLLDRHSAVREAVGWPGEHLAGLRSLIWDYPPGTATSQLGFGHWSRLLGAWFAAVDAAVLRPSLDRGLTVVADSWWPKFAARFALTVGLPAAEAVFDGVTTPAAVVWLDVPPRDAVLRRTQLRRTESGEWAGLAGGDAAFVDYQGRVRESYGQLAGAYGWLRIPAGAEADVVASAYRLWMEVRS
jgi:dTMP kinase